MFRRKILLFAVCCLIICACKKDKATKGEEDDILKIELADDRQPVNISSFVSGMDAIKLETSRRSLLANISEIKISDNLIYITDAIFKGVYVFDFNGSLIRTLNREGRGAGEYLSVDDFIIDKKKNTIEILDGLSMKIHIFDLTDFTFKNSFSLPFTFCFKFSKINDIYYFKTIGSRNQVGDKKTTNSEVIAYNIADKQVIPLFDRVLPLRVNEAHQAWEFGNIFTTNNKGDIFVSLAWHDNIHKIEGKLIKPFILVNAGHKAIPARIKKASYDEKMAFLNSKQAKGKIGFFKVLMYEGNDFIIGYGLGGFPFKVCYYMQLNNGKDIYSTDNIKNDLLPFPYENIEIGKVEKGYIISVLYPHKESENKQLLQHFDVSESDNPIILLFKLKK